jgi:hypothetical protein
MTMQRIESSWAVHAGAWRETSLDTEDMSLEDIAERLYSEASSPSLCHQCSDEMSDPELVELTQITIDGVDYTQTDNGTWVVYE